MIKKIIIGVGISSVLLLVGCGQPSFNQNSTGITFVDGKPYSIPRGAYYEITTKRTYDKTEYEHTVFKKSGSPELYKYATYVDCGLGEVRWIERKSQEKLASSINKAQQENKLKKVNTFRELYKIRYDIRRSGKSGCIKPLNQQEYQYKLNQQNQGAANRRVSSQNAAITSAALMPKTVNVNHSGSVDVYKY